MIIIVVLAPKLIIYAQVVMIIIILHNNLEHVLEIVLWVIQSNLVLCVSKTERKLLIFRKLYYLPANNPIVITVQVTFVYYVIKVIIYHRVNAFK